MNGTQQSEQPRAGQQPPIVSGPPTIDVDAIEDDDDVVESTASAFDRVSSLLLVLYPHSYNTCMCVIDSVSFLFSG